MRRFARSMDFSVSKERRASTSVELKSSDGLVVASCGFQRATASMSPVSATTRECLRRESSWVVMTNSLRAKKGRDLVCRYGGRGARLGANESPGAHGFVRLLLRRRRRDPLGARRRAARLDAAGAAVSRLPAPSLLARAALAASHARRAR